MNGGSQKTSNAETLATPQLDRALSQLGSSLRGLTLQQGVGTILLATGIWLAAAYLADWGLHLPWALRVANGLVLLGLPLFIWRRNISAPLKSQPDAAGLAVLLERDHPGSQDRLVSALNLRNTPPVDPSRPLVEALVQEAEELVLTLEPDRPLDRRDPRRRLGMGVLCAVMTGALLLSNPALASIFFARALGQDVAWPRNTNLNMALAGPTALGLDDSQDGILRTQIARGSDVLLVVTIEGTVPDEITLHFADGSSTLVPTAGARTLRPSLRNLQASQEVWATGGDDDRGLPHILLEVLEPPDISSIAFIVTPPAYTGLEQTVVRGTEVRALAGSQIEVLVRTDPAGAVGVLRVLGEEGVVDLVSRPWNLPGEPKQDGALGCTLQVDEERYFQIELTDARGLSNPDPGTYALQVIQDRQPEVVLLAPGTNEWPVVPGGAIPLRVRAEDDFRVDRLSFDLRSTADLETALVEADLLFQEAAPLENRIETTGHLVLASEILELNEIAGDDVEPGWSAVLQVMAKDSHPSTDHEAFAPPVRLRCVSGDEFLRMVKDGLARAGEDAGRLLQETRDLRTRTSQLKSALETGEVATDRELGSLLHSTRRMQGDAGGLGRDLASLAEGLLYNRLDQRAGPLLDALHAALSTQAARTFDPRPWRLVGGQLSAGRLGTPELAGELIALVELALMISEDSAEAASAGLTGARTANDPQTAETMVAAALDALDRSVTSLEALTTRLGEWDNFQSVLTLTKDLLNRQKNLTERTKKFAEGNK